MSAVRLLLDVGNACRNDAVSSRTPAVGKRTFEVAFMDTSESEVEKAVKCARMEGKHPPAQPPLPVPSATKTTIQNQVIREWQRVEKSVFQDIFEHPPSQRKVIGNAAIFMDDTGRSIH